MTKEEIEKIVGKELDDNHVSLDKKIYAGKLYFYKREIDNDHYFYVPAKETLYKMVFNPINYNDSFTETGKYPDSFQYPFDEYLSDGKIEEIYVLGKRTTGYKDPLLHKYGGTIEEVGEVLFSDTELDLLIQLRENCLKQSEILGKLIDLKS